MPTGHCVSTVDGVILAVDKGFCDMLRQPEEDLIGRSYRSITHPTDLGRSEGMLARLIDREAPVRFRKRYLRPDGSAVAANLFVSRFDRPDRLVSTLFWTDDARDLPPSQLWEAALRIRHVHAMRRAEFGDDVTADPVGALLVGVYLAEAEGRTIGIDLVAREMGVSAALATRWVRVLLAQGVLGADERLRDIHFTAGGLAKMERTLHAVYELPPGLLPD